MITRLRYLIARAREAPLSVIINKIWLSISPWLYYLRYRFQGISSGSPSAIANVRAFGLLLRSGFQPMSDISKASATVNQRFPCLGYGEGTIPQGRGWQQDQFHQFSWPDNYFARCDFVAASKRCDVKVPWEYSRLQYLLWLADGYLVKSDDRKKFREKFEELVRDWIANNLVGFGINWTSAMEVAIRSVNLGLAVSILADDLDDDLFASIVRSLEDHFAFIDRFPEISDVTGNHCLANLMGLYFLAYLLTGPQSLRTMKYLQLFTSEAEQQFEKDGGHIERAPTYHRLCLDMLALVFAMEIRAGRNTNNHLSAIFDRGIAFCKEIGSIAGRLPLIGDNDSGHVIWFGEDARDCTSLKLFFDVVQNRTASLPERTDLARWLLAVAGLEVAVDESEVTSREIENSCWSGSGFLVGRCRDVVTIMRVGEQGLEGRAPHDHDDSMSLWIFVGERDFIVDAGCYSYTLDPAIRESYIGSQAHNVVQPLGHERFAAIGGSVFKTVRGAPTAKNYSTQLLADHCQLNAELDVSSRGPFRSCRRFVRIGADSICVADEWEWTDSSQAEIRWHFGPGMNVAIDSEAQGAMVVDENQAIVARVEVSSDLDSGIEVLDYDFSPDYGVSQQCRVLRISTTAHNAGALSTTFHLRMG